MAPGILRGNPVFSTGLAIPFAVVSTISLKNALLLSASMFLTLIPVLMLACLLGDKIPSWLRLVVYPIVASLILMPVLYMTFRFFPAVYENLGIYLPLIAVNTVLVSNIYGVSRTKEYKKVFKMGLYNSTGFSLALCGLAFLRELIGAGAIFGMPLPFISFTIPGILIPFSGFILLGLLAAFFRFMRRMTMLHLIRKQNRSPQQLQEPVPQSGTDE